MAASGDNDELISGINVTPLVDVVLVLLIILMVTAQFVAAQGMDMELPKAGTGQSVEHPVRLGIDADGALFIDKQPVTQAQLVAQLTRLKGATADLRTVIAADGRVPHERVIQTMDLLRGLGIAKIAFSVRPKEGP